MRDTAKGDATAQSLNALKGRVSVQIRVTDDESVDAAAVKVDIEYGHVDALVNDAVVCGKTRSIRRLMSTWLVSSV